MDETTETEDSIAFKTIFGYKPSSKAKGVKGASPVYDGDEKLQESVLDDILGKFPELREGQDSGWSTKPKATLQRLSAYVENRGTTRTNDEINRRSRLDFGLFKNGCDVKRKQWSKERVEEEWKKSTTRHHRMRSVSTETLRNLMACSCRSLVGYSGKVPLKTA